MDRRWDAAATQPTSVRRTVGETDARREGGGFPVPAGGGGGGRCC